MANATTNAILDNVRAALPGVGDDAIGQALFNVCDDLAREALKVAAPVDVDAAPDTWLPAAQWVPNYQALLAGTLASLYGQFAKPYFNPELAKYNLDKYLAYRTLSRTTEAGNATHLGTMPDRIITAVRSQIPTCRDETIRLELYTTIDCIRVDGFNLTPMLATAADPVNWLTVEQYEIAYVAILTGTLYRLYGQANMPWYSEPGYTANLARYEVELHKVRSYSAGQTTELDAVTERFVSAVRAQIPNITDEAVKLALFDAVSTVAVDGFISDPPLSTTSNPATWLSASEYEQGFQAIFAGLLAALFAQGAMPWANPELSAAHTARFQTELHKVRAAVAGGTPYTNSIVLRLQSAARAQIPLVTYEATRMVLFDAVNQVLVDGFNLPPIEGITTDPTAWLTAAQYEQAYQAILAGMLAGLYAQSAVPWGNGETSATWQTRFQQELHKVRAAVAGESPHVDTMPERLMATARAEIPNVTVPAVRMALFGAVNQLRIDAFRLAALTGTDLDPAAWLTDAQYEQAYQAALAGMLSTLYSQPTMPWANAEIGAAYSTRFAQELHKVRSATAGAGGPANDTIPERLISAVRAQVPNVTDEAVELALFGVVNKVRIDAYELAPLLSAVGGPPNWINADLYEQSYLAILAGLFAAVFAQPAMPWTNLELATAQEARFAHELQQVRSAVAGTHAGLDPIRLRIVQSIRAEIPEVRPEAVELAMFTTVSRIRVEALRQPALLGQDVDPADWLTQAEYSQCYQAILAGTLAALYAQAGASWYSDALHQAKWLLYQAELLQVRAAVAGNSASTDTIAERVVSDVRAQIPGARDEAIKIEVFNTANRIRVDAYRMVPLHGGSNNPLDWFTTEQYEQAYNALVAGTLAGMFGQAASPWYNQEQFGNFTAIYLVEVNHLRVINAGLAASTDTIPERIVSTVRAQIQLVRDESVELALFNVVNKVRAEAYSLPPLTGSATNYTTWLSTAQYEQSYLAVLYGTLAQLYGQSNMPWYNLDQFKAHNILFLQELDLVGDENLEPEGPVGGVRDILEQARSYLPGARDEVMVVELRSAMDEFLKFTQVWQEEVKFSGRPTKTVYELVPFAKAEIVRVIDVYDPATQIGSGPFLLYPIAKLQLKHAPSEARSLLAQCVLSILTRKLDDTCAGANWGVPVWIVERWQEVLLNGLLWRMMMQQQKSYTNTELGLFHGRRWRAGLADCRGATSQKNVYDGQTWRYPAYA